MKKNTILIRVTALFLTVFLMTQELGAASEIFTQRRGSTFFGSKLALPAHLAQVRTFYQHPGSKQTVVLLEDAHVNESAQQNIAKTIDFLLHQFPIRTIFVEAGNRSESLSFLRKSASLEARKRVADKYLKKGWLHGVEYLDLLSDKPFEIWGVEKKELYRKSVLLYADLKNDRPRVNAYLDKVERTLEFLKTRTFNPLLLSLDTKRKLFLKDDLPFTGYVTPLMDAAGSVETRRPEWAALWALKSLKMREGRVDFDKAQRQLLEWLENLSPEERTLFSSMDPKNTARPGSFRKNEKDAFLTGLLDQFNDRARYPDLSRYVEYVRAARKLEAKKILEQSEKLEAVVFESLAVSDAEKRLLHYSRSLELVRKLVGLRLTSSEYQQVKRDWQKRNLPALTGFANRLILELGSNYEEALFLNSRFEKAVKKALDFYALTFERNHYFVDAALAKMTAEKQNTSILVVGGFHTEHLSEILKTRGVSYVIISPAVFHETNIEKYERILLGNLNNLAPKNFHAASSRAFYVGTPFAKSFRVPAMFSGGMRSPVRLRSAIGHDLKFYAGVRLPEPAYVYGNDGRPIMEVKLGYNSSHKSYFITIRHPENLWFFEVSLNTVSTAINAALKKVGYPGKRPVWHKTGDRTMLHSNAVSEVAHRNDPQEIARLIQRIRESGSQSTQSDGSRLADGKSIRLSGRTLSLEWDAERGTLWVGAATDQGMNFSQPARNRVEDVVAHLNQAFKFHTNTPELEARMSEKTGFLELRRISYSDSNTSYSEFVPAIAFSVQSLSDAIGALDYKKEANSASTMVVKEAGNSDPFQGRFFDKYVFFEWRQSGQAQAISRILPGGGVYLYWLFNIRITGFAKEKNAITLMSYFDPPDPEHANGLRQIYLFAPARYLLLGIFYFLGGSYYNDASAVFYLMQKSGKFPIYKVPSSAFRHALFPGSFRDQQGALNHLANFADQINELDKPLIAKAIHPLTNNEFNHPQVRAAAKKVDLTFGGGKNLTIIQNRALQETQPASGSRLSDKATQNLANIKDFLKQVLRSDEKSGHRPDPVRVIRKIVEQDLDEDMIFSLLGSGDIMYKDKARKDSEPYRVPNMDLAFVEAETIAPLLYKKALKLIQLHGGTNKKIVIFGRDGELFYDVVRLLYHYMGKEKDVVLMPASTSLADSLLREAENGHGSEGNTGKKLKRFFEKYDIDEYRLEKRQKYVFVDTGFHGSISFKIKQTIKSLFHGSYHEEDFEDFLLYSPLKNNQGFPKQLLRLGYELFSQDLKKNPDLVRRLFPRSGQVVKPDDWDWSVDDLDYLDFRLVAAIQTMPKYHGPSRYIDVTQNPMVIKRDIHDSRTVDDLDKTNPDHPNQSFVNPVAALAVQIHVLRAVLGFVQADYKSGKLDFLKRELLPEVQIKPHSYYRLGLAGLENTKLVRRSVTLKNIERFKQKLKNGYFSGNNHLLFIQTKNGIENILFNNPPILPNTHLDVSVSELNQYLKRPNSDHRKSTELLGFAGHEFLIRTTHIFEDIFNQPIVIYQNEKLPYEAIVGVVNLNIVKDFISSAQGKEVLLALNGDSKNRSIRGILQFQPNHELEIKHNNGDISRYNLVQVRMITIVAQAPAGSRLSREEDKGKVGAVLAADRLVELEALLKKTGKASRRKGARFSETNTIRGVQDFTHWVRSKIRLFQGGFDSFTHLSQRLARNEIRLSGQKIKFKILFNEELVEMDGLADAVLKEIRFGSDGRVYLESETVPQGVETSQFVPVESEESPALHISLIEGSNLGVGQGARLAIESGRGKVRIYNLQRHQPHQIIVRTFLARWIVAAQRAKPSVRVDKGVETDLQLRLLEANRDSLREREALKTENKPSVRFIHLEGFLPADDRLSRAMLSNLTKHLIADMAPGSSFAFLGKSEQVALAREVFQAESRSSGIRAFFNESLPAEFAQLPAIHLAAQTYYLKAVQSQASFADQKWFILEDSADGINMSVFAFGKISQIMREVVAGCMENAYRLFQSSSPSLKAVTYPDFLLWLQGQKAVVQNTVYPALEKVAWRTAISVYLASRQVMRFA